MDLKLELVLLPVTDVDRAKDFYVRQAGFQLDVDVEPAEGVRVAQTTPPGSARSIAFGVGITDAVPETVSGLHLVVTDIEAARVELLVSHRTGAWAGHRGRVGTCSSPELRASAHRPCPSDVPEALRRVAAAADVRR